MARIYEVFPLICSTCQTRRWCMAPASGAPGGQGTYSDLAIEAALTIRRVFHLPLRQTEGSLASVAADGAYDAGSVYETAQGKGKCRVERSCPRGTKGSP